MSVQIYDFPEHISGDTYLGCRFTIEVNSAPLNLAGATIELNFGNGQHVFTVGSGLTIVSPSTTGKFDLNEQIIDWAPGIYKFELIITLVSGRVKKYLTGTWRISNG